MHACMHAYIIWDVHTIDMYVRCLDTKRREEVAKQALKDSIRHATVVGKRKTLDKEGVVEVVVNLSSC